MANQTSKIEWTDATWNPVTGCSKVSQGCKHCYAERIFQRPYPGRDFTDVRTHSDRLEWPLKWKGSKQAKAEGRPSRIFVNSMSDLFHESVPEEFIRTVFRVMGEASQHVFQVLTKRPERMRKIVKAMEDEGGFATLSGDDECFPFPNVWLGVSVEDQKPADERIPLLLQTPASVRFVSAEPLLGPTDLLKWLRGNNSHDGIGKGVSCVRCGGSILRGRRRDDMEASSANRREPCGYASLLEGASGADPCGKIGVGRLPNGDVLGQEDEAQSLCPSCRVDDLQQAGHTGWNAGKSQGRNPNKHQAIELGSCEPVRECDSRDTSFGAYDQRQRQAGRGKLLREAYTRAGNENQSPKRQDVSIEDSRDVRHSSGNGIRNYPPQELETPRIDWVIAGGESGPHARPSHPDWFRNLRDQCAVEPVVPFFFKQWGEWVPDSKELPRGGKIALIGPDYETWANRVGKKRAGRLLDGREWNEFPKTGEYS